MLAELLICTREATDSMNDRAVIELPSPADEDEDRWVDCGTAAVLGSEDRVSSLQITFTRAFYDELASDVPSELRASEVTEAVRAVLYLVPTTFGRPLAVRTGVSVVGPEGVHSLVFEPESDRLEPSGA